ncbi:hypothetical protein [Pyrococcus sp. ST04]|uniref:hypothetical protein n=1 Tax=Pyrococcus sp. ST04 TaxID=1183377 RepID=UPI0002605F26|nr:hypothetical protein [Pyrococcus sp. ST04]AFK22662.1 hypothetical protein Py04_1087 [Pyrococcus sp. ST04]
MNFLVPLIFGILIGYILRDRGRLNTEMLMSIAVIVLVFLMGIKAGNVKINAINALLISMVLAMFTIAGSLSLALVLWRERQ